MYRMNDDNPLVFHFNLVILDGITAVLQAWFIVSILIRAASLGILIFLRSAPTPVQSMAFSFPGNQVCKSRESRLQLQGLSLCHKHRFSCFIFRISSLISFDTGFLPGVLCLYVQKFFTNLCCQSKSVEGFTIVR